MDLVEYLVGYGQLGDFGRFRPSRPLACARGSRVVVRSARGLEVGVVRGVATPGHAHFLPNSTVGILLRLPTPEDDRQEELMRGHAARLLDRGIALKESLGLPLELIDAEVLLDGGQAILHYLRWQECDPRPLVSALSREFELQVTLADLAQPRLEEEEEPHGCGSCGSDGGCGSCGSGGCGSCGTAKPEEVQSHFAELRQQMERRQTLL